MKSYLTSLCLLVSIISGCSGNRKQDKKQVVNNKDNQQVDFIGAGMENLDASRNMKDIICQCWDYSEDTESTEGLDASSAIDVVYRGYCLFSDGTMVKDPRGTMQPGQWVLRDQSKPVTLVFTLKNGDVETHQLAYLSPANMKLAHQEDGRKKIIDLQGAGFHYKDPGKNPFHISNNLWRLKPSAPETEAAIKDRLKACLHFFVLFYEEKISTHAQEISFIGLPSCFKWYGGAIYLQNKKELQQKWVNTFYNQEQALKAYKLADKLISQKYNWPKSGNWVMKNAAVLRQMEEKLSAL